MKSILLQIIVFTLLPFAFARASDYEQFQDWRFVQTLKSNKVYCYLLSTPIKQSGTIKNRGEPFFLVTNIVSDPDEISTSSGFYYSDKSDVELSFSSKKFYLFPHKAIAFANNKYDDIDSIKEMQKNYDMIVTGVESRTGKIANDTYSLIGFSDAYKKMKEVCK